MTPFFCGLPPAATRSRLISAARAAGDNPRLRRRAVAIDDKTTHS